MAQAFGQNSAVSDTSEFNKHNFATDQLIRLISTATLVQIKKFIPYGQQQGGGGGSGGGGQGQGSGTQTSGQGGLVAPIGLVDVMPLVNLVDGAGTPTKHGTVHNLTYFRLQSGTQAIIMDPQPGDLCIAVFADRDISAVKKSYQQSNPGSRRRNDMADGMVFGVGLSNKKPKQYFQFDNQGNMVLSPDGGTTTITLSAGKIVLRAQTVEIDSSNILLGGNNASKPIGMQGSVDSNGDTLVSNLSTTTKTM